jgi:tetratricopeptide (TPR) repeat protein
MSQISNDSDGVGGGGEDVDQQLEMMNTQSFELMHEQKSASAMRLAQEMARIAQAHGRLNYYIQAKFQVLNNSEDNLESFAGQDAGLEALALLENRERAVKFQGDFDEEQYQALQWMVVPIYHLYANAAGRINGYNSKGLQQCISDGMEVCQRTGSPYITSFREFAFDVMLAADDFDMAIHHAKVSATTKIPSQQQDRRWAGAKDLMTAWLSVGHFPEALKAYELARELEGTWSFPELAKRTARHSLQTILAMTGRLDEMAKHFPEAESVSEVPASESPCASMQDTLAEAVVAGAQGDFEKSIALLTPVDRMLSERKLLGYWFDVRCRMVALHLLKGDNAVAQRLAKPLSQKAQDARDYMTQSRLAYMFSPGARVTPLGGAGPVSNGPWAAPEAHAVQGIKGETRVQEQGAAGDAGGPDEAQATPDAILEEVAKIGEGIPEGEEYGRQLAAKVLALDPAQVKSPESAIALLSLFSSIAGEAPDVKKMWAWASQMVQKFPKNAVILSMTADVGRRLLGREDAQGVSGLSRETLEPMIKSSLLLGDKEAGNFFRAGIFWFSMGDRSEAEHCLARAFRLDRSNSDLANVLAQVYMENGQKADALAVLELCIRENGADATMYVSTAALAMELERWQLAHTCMLKVKELAPEDQLTEYGLGVACLGLGRFEEALAAADVEAERFGMSLPVNSVRAPALAKLGRFKESREALKWMQDVDLTTADEGVIYRLKAAYERAWPAVDALAADDSLRRDVFMRVLGLGMAPNSAFEWMRQRQEGESDVSLFVCALRQPLDENWPSHASCLPGREEWTQYMVAYGVLAENEDQAVEMALSLQRLCYELEPEVLSLSGEGRFKDKAGVVWQSELGQPSMADASEDENGSES